MAKTPDFNQFANELWDVANVFRDDALHATERLETFSLFLFLNDVLYMPCARCLSAMSSLLWGATMTACLAMIPPSL